MCLSFTLTSMEYHDVISYISRDATGTVKKSRKLLLDRGSGGRAPSGVQGQRPGGGSRGRSALEARAFSQSKLPRKPPIDTHGRYTCIQYMHGGTKERRGKKKKKKSEGLKKSEFRQKSEKRHPCISLSRMSVSAWNLAWKKSSLCELWKHQ